MPIITDYNEVIETYQEAAEKGIALPVFCTEDRETLEAILSAANEYGKEIGVENLPVIPAWTSRYPARGQMTLLSADGDAVLGNQLMFSDLECFTGENSPYRKLRILPHLDHAFPWRDMDILTNFADRFASVMCDASEKPFQENMEITAQYVEKVKGRVVVEGAVDEVFEEDGKDSRNEPTTAENAQLFLDKTGVDIIVPNVGTEHRATADQINYLSKSARSISKKVGKIMCLHGTSSVKQEDLSKLPDDGFVKINIYTTIAVHGGQALGYQLLDNLGNIFTEKQLKELVTRGVLGEDVLSENYGSTQLPMKPRLEHVTNPLRRDAWFNAVRNRCTDFFKVFNYRRYGA